MWILKNKAFLTLMISMQFMKCTSPIQPNIEDIYKQYFSIEQLAEVEEAILGAINNYSTYHLSDVAIYRDSEWELLRPICLNSDFTRAIAMLGIRSRGGLSNSVDIDIVIGFKYEDQWHFLFGDYHPLLMEEPDGTVIDEYTFERINEIAHKKYFSKATKYNRLKDQWQINDDFFLHFMDNGSWLARKDRLAEVDWRKLPNSYFVGRYMNIVNIRNRRIELLKSIWAEEDSLRSAGAIDDTEWDKILSMRNPETTNDWKLVKAFHKEIEKDSIIQSIHLKRRN